ncbi:hypothetical protein PENTCL1PPCAC_22089, partial [Pristionchus entomophagus]
DCTLAETMAFWDRAALLPWPLINNNNANNNNGGGGGGAVAAPGEPAPPPLPAINPVRAAAAVGVRAAARRGLRQRGMRGARRWAPRIVCRQLSDTSTARDQKGDELMLLVGEEITDRFARLKSNQHLAAQVPRTGVVDLERATTLSDEREAAERALLDRFVPCMERAVGDGIEGGATEQADAELLPELRAWQQRVRQEREQNAEARAYLLARRAELAQKEAALNAACRDIEEASTQMTLPPAPVWS